MYFIAHRGNISGPSPRLENSPEHIDNALSNGYDVEIDLRGSFANGFYLGHDHKQYEISIDWLFQRAHKLWIHAKDIESVSSLIGQSDIFNIFWHQEDDYTITSKGFIWTYPGKVLSPSSICVMPEEVQEIYDIEQLKNCAGICSDFIGEYK
tara:strand:+ start:774 stop:1229 length:456 start_codon:yes stop_codon:yes gene_type:complete